MEVKIIKPQFSWSELDDFQNYRADYVTWNGANPDYSTGRRILAKGPSTSLRVERLKPCGQNKELCKGPKIGLAKGSSYFNRPLNDVVCN
jgi:hypothetical protein